ncbi:hypothetical protein BaRGS_00032517 [Batillaria attramentaria]|uniref:Uncharacterized protein n=2 Tax=Batillaria attramentaria TaxID=370345 RepID=A0ABD0JMR7_9CAEN
MSGQPKFSIPPAQARSALERTLQRRRKTSAQHGKWQLPVKSSIRLAKEKGAWGHFRRWERSSHLTGQLPPASSWAAPSQ